MEIYTIQRPSLLLAAACAPSAPKPQSAPVAAWVAERARVSQVHQVQTQAELGLLLGSMGLGLVVLRNVLDRQGELAMLRAMGIGKGKLKRMILFEHGGLLVVGLGCGVVAALVAVGPALQTPGAEIPGLSLAGTVAAIGLSGLIWIWIAARIALGGLPLDALRNE